MHSLLGIDTSLYSNKLFNRANNFYKYTLRDSSIISTSLLGKEVYNIKLKDSSTTLGYLGFLPNYSKVESLSSYIIKLGLDFKLKSFIIILNYTRRKQFLFIIIKDNSIYKEEWLDSPRELAREVIRFKPKNKK